MPPNNFRKVVINMKVKERVIKMETFQDLADFIGEHDQYNLYLEEDPNFYLSIYGWKMVFGVKNGWYGRIRGSSEQMITNFICRKNTVSVHDQKDNGCRNDAYFAEFKYSDPIDAIIDSDLVHTEFAELIKRPWIVETIRNSPFDR